MCEVSHKTCFGIFMVSVCFPCGVFFHRTPDGTNVLPMLGSCSLSSQDPRQYVHLEVFKSSVLFCHILTFALCNKIVSSHSLSF